jgi:hypothetical protein
MFVSMCCCAKLQAKHQAAQPAVAAARVWYTACNSSTSTHLASHIQLGFGIDLHLLGPHHQLAAHCACHLQHTHRQTQTLGHCNTTIVSGSLI